PREPACRARLLVAGAPASSACRRGGGEDDRSGIGRVLRHAPTRQPARRLGLGTKQSDRRPRRPRRPLQRARRDVRRSSHPPPAQLGRLPRHPDPLRILAGTRGSPARSLLLPAPRRERLDHRASLSVKKRILFLCTGNAARSQMAEGLARAFHGEEMDVVSAGSRPAGWVHPLAIRAMAAIGVDISDQQSKSAEEFLREPFDVVVTVCDSAAKDCPLWPGAKRIEHWPIEDPSW